MKLLETADLPTSYAENRRDEKTTLIGPEPRNTTEGFNVERTYEVHTKVPGREVGDNNIPDAKGMVDLPGAYAENNAKASMNKSFGQDMSPEKPVPKGLLGSNKTYTIEDPAYKPEVTADGTMDLPTSFAENKSSVEWIETTRGWQRQVEKPANYSLEKNEEAEAEVDAKEGKEAPGAATRGAIETLKTQMAEAVAADPDGRPPSRVPAIWNRPVMTGTGLVQCNVKTPEAEKGRRPGIDSSVPSAVKMGQSPPVSLLSTALVEQRQDKEPESVDQLFQGPGGQQNTALSSVRSAKKSDGGQSPAVTRPIEAGAQVEVRTTQTSGIVQKAPSKFVAAASKFVVAAEPSIVRKAPSKSVVAVVSPRRRPSHLQQQPEQDSPSDYVNGDGEGMSMRINTKALYTRVKTMRADRKEVSV